MPSNLDFWQGCSGCFSIWIRHSIPDGKSFSSAMVPVFLRNCRHRVECVEKGTVTAVTDGALRFEAVNDYGIYCRNITKMAGASCNRHRPFGALGRCLGSVGRWPLAVVWPETLLVRPCGYRLCCRRVDWPRSFPAGTDLASYWFSDFLGRCCGCFGHFSPTPCPSSGWNNHGRISRLYFGRRLFHQVAFGGTGSRMPFWILAGSLAL